MDLQITKGKFYLGLYFIYKCPRASGETATARGNVACVQPPPPEKYRFFFSEEMGRLYTGTTRREEK